MKNYTATFENSTELIQENFKANNLIEAKKLAQFYKRKELKGIFKTKVSYEK
jgi:hypothetical protein